MYFQSIVRAILFSLSFIPFWIAYTILLYTSNRNSPEYENTAFLDWLEYSAIIVGISTLLGVFNLFRVLGFKKSRFTSTFMFLTKEAIIMVVFVVAWLVITELIFINFYYGQDIQQMSLNDRLMFIIENTGKLYSGMFLYVSYTGICYAYYFYIEQRKSLEREKLAQDLAKEMKMQAMMNYMQPHFFFNCISSISELIHIDPNKADEALDKLSEMLRYLIDNKKQFHSIESELKLTRNYVDLQDIRHGKKFHYSESINMVDLSIEIPVLTIQILVENSFNHASLSNDTKKCIEILVAVQMEKEALHIYVCDSGEPHNTKTHKGRGLELLVSRINAAFETITFEHGFSENTFLNKPGYQSHIIVRI